MIAYKRCCTYLSRSYGLLALVIIMYATAIPTVAAGNAGAFHEAMGDALSHYRQALFYLRRDAPDVASLELESFVAKWQGVIKAYADNPPPVYGKDGKWRATLDDIATHGSRGLASALAEKSKQAGQDLKPIRSAVVQLRRRNGLFLFPDYVEEANKAFSALYEFRRNPPTFDNAAQTDALRQALTQSIQWYEKCRDNAPKQVAEDPQFKRLIADSLFYLNRMWVAIDEKNQLAVINILRRVVSSDDILWLRFG